MILKYLLYVLCGSHAGVLVAKKQLFKNKVPNGSGGGAVFFVSRKDHRYLKVSTNRVCVY